jgi:hypothetical protein
MVEYLEEVLDKNGFALEEDLFDIGATSFTSIRGGFLDDIDCFDNNVFNISHDEACMMDPQERLFMEAEIPLG